LAQQLLDQYKTRLDQVALIPAMGGAFVDGESIYSKLETGRFPSEATVIADIGKKL
jgi:predicted Rdx family selenoprotein